ncbi:urease accessory protein UreE [Methylobacterium sp. NEAU 140]|uniref:urease accessory protein UreE n=1 Tax=Methylobacterium sp. NEAU 140 TaxID=3064945 RepID=UPI002733DD86|nr:urease accessory protein UreE [Methylobacterium sp. NEAU 140]MDP4025156.1 urease accessory protein UreE [Methylobacterium sp. NEAU 140]
MPTATTIVRRAAVRPDRVADTVELDHAGRAAAAGPLVAAGGLGFDVALTKAAALEDGDALRLDDGRLVAVRAAPEALLEVRAENPARLMRLAWQLGGSHVPAEIGADALHVPASPATAELVRGQGCTASPVTRPFRPERAAHDHSTCGHDHGHGHAHHDHAHQGHAHHEHDHHDHAHGSHDHHAHDQHDQHEHGHGHEHGHEHANAHAHGHHHHGPGCGCGHEH